MCQAGRQAGYTGRPVRLGMFHHLLHGYMIFSYSTWLHDLAYIVGGFQKFQNEKSENIIRNPG